MNLTAEEFLVLELFKKLLSFESKHPEMYGCINISFIEREDLRNRIEEMIRYRFNNIDEKIIKEFKKHANLITTLYTKLYDQGLLEACSTSQEIRISNCGIEKLEVTVSWKMVFQQYNSYKEQSGLLNMEEWLSDTYMFPTLK